MSPTSANKPVVLITGGAGRIGVPLRESLSDDYEVVSLDIQHEERPGASAHRIHCDFTNAESIEAALAQVRSKHGQKIASILHLADHFDSSGRPNTLDRELTIEGTRKLFDHLRSFDVEQFVYPSTILVMQAAENGSPLTEESELDADWTYPKTQRIAESVVERNSDGIHTVVVRLASVYDEGCRCLPLAARIDRIYRRRLSSYFFPGDADCGQAFIHLRDAVACLRQIVVCRNRLPAKQTFVVGEEDVMSYAELRDALGQMIHGKSWPTIGVPPAVMRAGAWVKDKFSDEDEDLTLRPWMLKLSDQDYPVSIEQARMSLDWDPQHSLRHLLPLIIGNFNGDRLGWYESNELPLPENLRERVSNT